MKEGAAWLKKVLDARAALTSLRGGSTAVENRLCIIRALVHIDEALEAAGFGRDEVREMEGQVEPRVDVTASRPRGLSPEESEHMAKQLTKAAAFPDEAERIIQEVLTTLNPLGQEKDLFDEVRRKVDIGKDYKAIWPLIAGIRAIESREGW